MKESTKEKIINVIGILAFLIIMTVGIIFIDYRISITQPSTNEVVNND